LWTGANRQWHTQRKLDAIVGDLDSVHAETLDYYGSSGSQTKIVRYEDQDSTDFDKATRYVCVENPGINIIVFGGLGGRVDQGLSTLHHLFSIHLHQRDVVGPMYLLSDESFSFVLTPGCHEIQVREEEDERRSGDIFDKYVGIVPLRATSIITTQGLEWDITDWRTTFGEIITTSNHVLPQTSTVIVKTTNYVLFTIALKSPQTGKRQETTS